MLALRQLWHSTALASLPLSCFCVLVCALTRSLPTGAAIHQPLQPRLLRSSTIQVLDHSDFRPLQTSAAPVLGHSSSPPLCRSSTQMPDTRRCRCGSRHSRSVPTLDHSCSTASVLGRSPRPVPVLGGTGTRNLGARPHFDRKSSVFVHLHASVVVCCCCCCCCCHRHCCYCSFFNPPLICFYPSRGDNV